MFEYSKYELLHKQVDGIFEGESAVISNTANFSALLFNSIENINWLGFYFFDGKDLMVGPFQGKPACVRIDPKRGVCGASFTERKTMVVPDVHEFPGHIACDSESRSELVIPIIKGNMIYGVFDIDSPIKNRFNDVDVENFESLMGYLIDRTDFSTIPSEQC